MNDISINYVLRNCCYSSEEWYNDSTFITGKLSKNIQLHSICAHEMRAGFNANNSQPSRADPSRTAVSVSEAERESECCVCIYAASIWKKSLGINGHEKTGSVSGKAKPFDGFMVNLLDAIKYTLLTQNRIIQRFRHASGISDRHKRWTPTQWAACTHTNTQFSGGDTKLIIIRRLADFRQNGKIKWPITHNSQTF